MAAVHDVLRYLLARVPHSTQDEHDQVAAVIDQDEHDQVAAVIDQDEAGQTPAGKES